MPTDPLAAIAAAEAMRSQAIADRLIGAEQLWLHACRQAAQEGHRDWLCSAMAPDTAQQPWCLRLLHHRSQGHARTAQAMAGCALLALLLANGDSYAELAPLLAQAAAQWQATREQTQPPELPTALLAANTPPAARLHTLIAHLYRAQPGLPLAPLRDLARFCLSTEHDGWTRSSTVEVLLDLHDDGLVASLCLDLRPEGLGQFYADPRAMAFLRRDEASQQAFANAWAYAQAQPWFRSSADVRWRLIPWPNARYRARSLREVRGSSIGAGCALALTFLFDAQQPDPSWAITGAVTPGGALTGVTGYPAKLEAARIEQRRVIIPAVDAAQMQAERGPLRHSREPYLRGAATVEQAAAIAATGAAPDLVPLTWEQVRAACHAVSQRTHARIQDTPARYLERRGVRAAVERFLAADTPGFILLGPSGSGKSQFVRALADELHQQRPDLAVLHYSGGEMGDDLPARIAYDLAALSDPGAPEQAAAWSHLTRQMARLVGPAPRQLVLLLDAINEHPQAAYVLRQLHELLHTHRHWLKVVISARPETWRSLTRGLYLAPDLYAQEPPATHLPAAEPLVYSAWMEPFSPAELPEVYASYQQAFNVQTDYADLSRAARAVIQEPLRLWLVAATWAGQCIPATLHAADLITQYLAHLRASGRLTDASLTLLESHLLPLMLREGRYTNRLTSAEIAASGPGLYAALHSTERLPDGRQRNQPFLDLLDCGILAQQVGMFEQRISFRYEQFYDYFVGKALHARSHEQPERGTFFVGIIQQTDNAPLLWGGTQQALLREIEADGWPIIEALCRTPVPRVREMLAAVLTTAGREESEPISALLRRLLPPQEQARHWLRPTRAAPDSAARSAHTLAITVAGALCIPAVLYAAAAHPDPGTRTTAARTLYHLWRRDPQAGFALLERLAQHAAPDQLAAVHLGTLEVVIGVSLLIFFNHRHAPLVAERLQTIWQGILARLFRVRAPGNLADRLARPLIREQVVRLTARLIFEVLEHSLLRHYPSLHTASRQFFRLSAAERAAYHRMVACLDWAREVPATEVEAALSAVIPINNRFVALLYYMTLTVHLLHAPHVHLPMQRRLFAHASRHPAPNQYVMATCAALSNVLDHDPTHDDLFYWFLHTVEVCQDYYTRHGSNPTLQLDLPAPEAFGLAPYLYHQYRREQTVATPWLQSRIEEALASGNLAFFRFALETELPVVGIELRQPRIALAALSLFFARATPPMLPLIQAFLARLRVHAPDDVEQFLAAQQASPALRLAIRTSEPVETIGDMVVMNFWFVVRDHILMQSPELRRHLVRLFAHAAEVSRAHDWLDAFIREAINAMYGSELLKPSVGYRG